MPSADVAKLTDCAHPHLIGVRHHAPSLAAAMPALLDAAQPDVLLVELPEEMQPWLEWLAHPDTKAPVALAGVGPHGLGFYPFADFSPELAALRWAFRNGVAAKTCDLPLARRAADNSAEGSTGLHDALRKNLSGRDDDVWDRLVEAPAPGSTPEQLRRAALAVGWALRRDGTPGQPDLLREAWMRKCVSEHKGQKITAVIGAYHAAAFLEEKTEPDFPEAKEEVTTSLIPYTHALLDSRSGYPAGIRDPAWQQAVYEAAGDPQAVYEALTRTAVRITSELRTLGHPSGPPDSRELIRMAGDLARLRGLPAPGRGELVEAAESVLTHGETLGRGRAVATALERVLVGARTGGPTPKAPRSGLAPAVEKELKELSLPGPHDPKPRDLRLDPLRSGPDLRREILLQQLATCQIPYGERTAVQGTGGTDAVTTRWTATWTPSAAALLEFTGMRGATPAQAAEGMLRDRLRRADHTCALLLQTLEQAAACALPQLTEELLQKTQELLPATGTLPELLAATSLLERLRRGHVPGLPEQPEAADALDELATAAVRALDGLAGSEDPADARALVELARRADALGGVRLTEALARLAAQGSPLMKGAAGAVRVLLAQDDPAAFGTRVASWVDAATTLEARRTLTGSLAGTLTAAGPLLDASPETLAPLLDRVGTLPDAEFLPRLPALRGGFDTLSPAARDRLCAVVEEELGSRIDTDADPAALAAATHADQAARQLLSLRGLLPDEVSTTNSPKERQEGNSPHTITPVDRWRLILGQKKAQNGQSRRLAAALDELYGTGRGEGSRGDLGNGNGQGGSRDRSYPSVRDWSEDLADLFGTEVREEVLAAAVDSGRTDVLDALDPDAVRPSVDLLRTILAHAGGLPESRVARLRPLVERIIAELTRELATQLRPALNGLTLPRPSRRPGGGLDLARTVRANLATARPRPGGGVTLIPERPVFRTKAQKSADWRLILVVDVSGSMEASTVWSALTASILAGVPALTTHFLAFSTQVIDFTDQVHDPLGLLLGVRVGGGTHIAGALRHARELVTVPSRTLIAVVSDFEEGGPVTNLLAEVRHLTDSGCHLLGCASLDDAGKPRYSTAVAGRLVAAGMPVAALSPTGLARWIGEKVR